MGSRCRTASTWTTTSRPARREHAYPHAVIDQPRWQPRRYLNARLLSRTARIQRLDLGFRGAVRVHRESREKGRHAHVLERLQDISLVGKVNAPSRRVEIFRVARPAARVPKRTYLSYCNSGAFPLIFDKHLEGESSRLVGQCSSASSGMKIH